MNFGMDCAQNPIDFNKKLATYYVIVDDEGIYSGNSTRLDWTPERDVLDVQRASDHPVERALQRTDFTRSCFGAQAPKQFLTVEAVSHGHAAWLVKAEFVLARDFQSLIDVFFADEMAFGGAGFDDHQL
ncbi:hypothetical protein ACPXCP_38990 [Streptomyces sp. DT20]|uniref:hypothetical protein n=1 Tax=Streptomyces sp. DT20 TaxID=3416519 RepID=UPI003CF87B31